MEINNNGRYNFTINGRTFFVEPIGGNHTIWGDIDPATKEINGSYGEKYKGCVDFSESIITKENGFKNIIDLPSGVSPDSYIKNLLNNKI